FDVEADPEVSKRLEADRDEGGADWLFVGRVAPNKCQHDIVKAFAFYREMYDERARLHLVGGSASHAYWTALRRFVVSAGLGRSVRMTGSVSHGALAAHFRK